jgi:hypothetical protein
MYQNRSVSRTLPIAPPSPTIPRQAQPSAEHYRLFPKDEGQENDYSIPQPSVLSQTRATQATNDPNIPPRSQYSTAPNPGRAGGNYEVHDTGQRPRHFARPNIFDSDTVVKDSKRSSSTYRPSISPQHVKAQTRVIDSETPKMSDTLLPRLAQDFVNIPYADYEKCRSFILENPDILKVDPNLVIREALKAQSDGKVSRARNFVHQSLILRTCSRVRAEEADAFLRRMITKDRDTLRQFLQDFDTTMNVVKQASAKEGRNREAVVPHLSEARVISRSSPEQGASFSATGNEDDVSRRLERMTMKDTDGRNLREGNKPPPLPAANEVAPGRRPTSPSVGRGKNRGLFTRSLSDPTSSVIAPDIQGDGEEREELDRRYFVRKDASKFFGVGRVFAMLWHEGKQDPKGRFLSDDESSEPLRQGRYGERVFARIVRMVVVRQRHGYCWCIPINTYNSQGLLKKGLTREDCEAHAIIYMSGTAPFATDEETRLMTKKPIKVAATFLDQKLNKMSRLNFGKPYSVEWNVKVMDIGKVAEDSIPYLETYWRNEAMGV